MARFCWPRAILFATLAALAGCSGFSVAERPVWRTEAEEACLAQDLVQPSAWIEPASEIDGPGMCGLHHPFKVRALLDGRVAVTSAATLDCSMIAALEGWVRTVLQPAAQARFGEAVAEIRTMGAYSCRGINNERGANLSEHAFGNAIDIGAYVLQSGRVISVLRDWNGPDEQGRAFLREAHGGACGHFTTVLGPGSNSFHANHDHLDLARHGRRAQGSRRICQPAPDTVRPALPDAERLSAAVAGADDNPRLPPAAPAPDLQAFTASAAPSAPDAGSERATVRDSPPADTNP